MRIFTSSLVILALIAMPIDSSAASRRNTQSKTITLSGKIPTGYSAMLVAADSQIRFSSESSSGKIRFNRISKKFLKNATLNLVNSNGQFVGAVALRRKGDSGNYQFKGKWPENTTRLNLGEILIGEDDSISLKRQLAKAVVNTRLSATISDAGLRLGLPVKGSNQNVNLIRLRAGAEGAGEDLDGDSVINAFDVDDDGDGILDVSDSDTSDTTARENPFTTLFLPISDSLNVNIGEITQDDIDAKIGGENFFNLIFYFGQPSNNTSIDGAHIVCDDDLLYCRDSSAGGSSAIYSGVSESTTTARGDLWSNFNDDGSGHPNLEVISNNGSTALVAGIQPRVGTSQFKAGDLYRIEFMNGSRVASTSTLVLAPYFISVPALSQYNAGSGLQTIDYDSSPIPGDSSSNPIVLSSEGVLTLSFWKPQRQGIALAEDDDFIDMGHLHYGITINNNQGEFTCAGLYSALSPSALVEQSGGLGESDSPLSSAGATLFPLTDGGDDATPSPSNLLSFSVDLKSCLARGAAALGQSLPAGTYEVTLTAAGEQFAGGQNRAAQTFSVMIP